MLFTIRLNELAAEPASTKPLFTMLPAVRIVNCCPPLGVKPLMSDTSKVPSSNRAAGDRQPVVLAARRGAADFNEQRIGVGQCEAAFEADFGRAGAGGHAAVEVGRAGAEEIARPAHQAVEIDRADHRDRVVVDDRRVDGRVDDDQVAVVDRILPR